MRSSPSHARGLMGPCVPPTLLRSFGGQVAGTVSAVALAKADDRDWLHLYLKFYKWLNKKVNGKAPTLVILANARTQ